jgi:hypothetical protein
VADALHKDGYRTATPALGLASVSDDVAIVRSTLGPERGATPRRAMTGVMLRARSSRRYLSKDPIEAQIARFLADFQPSPAMRDEILDGLAHGDDADTEDVARKRVVSHA